MPLLLILGTVFVIQVFSFPLLYDEMIIIIKWSGLAKWSKLLEDSQEFNGLSSEDVSFESRMWFGSENLFEINKWWNQMDSNKDSFQYFILWETGNVIIYSVKVQVACRTVFL